MIRQMLVITACTLLITGESPVEAQQKRVTGSYRLVPVKPVQKPGSRAPRKTGSNRRLPSPATPTRVELNPVPAGAPLTQDPRLLQKIQNQFLKGKRLTQGQHTLATRNGKRLVVNVSRNGQVTSWQILDNRGLVVLDLGSPGVAVYAFPNSNGCRFDWEECMDRCQRAHAGNLISATNPLDFLIAAVDMALCTARCKGDYKECMKGNIETGRSPF